jgi:hypothetical protein
MSILNVNQIQPVGSGQTVTISAANITATGSITVGNSISIGTTTTAGRNAGVGTAIGTLIYNTSTLQLEVFNPNGTWGN